MTCTRLVVCGVALLLFVSAADAQRGKKDTKPGDKPADTSDKMPITKLAPAKLIPNLCLVKYPITTSSPECQAYFDQALGYFYSYVWMEAARSFETATKHDPNCPMAWWGLSRAIERWGKGQHAESSKKAHELMARASHREQLLIQARLQEKGMWPNVGDQDKRKAAAIDTIDTLLTLYDDDEEGWYARAQLAGGGSVFGGRSASAPFYKALYRLNPLHPGANHELVHHYENIKRPALGWLHAEQYMKSSPGIPHAFHMQAHLGMRIDNVTDRLGRNVLVTAYLGLLPSFFAQLRWLGGDDPYPGTAALALAVFVPKMCDSGAYFTGRLIGRHKMTPVLSPKKTWEGTIGGLVTAMLTAILIDRVGPWPVLHKQLALEIAFGLTVGVAGILGDLAESLIKRDCAKKDASQIMPGFGGVLDVVDSVIFAAPVVYVWLVLV